MEPVNAFLKLKNGLKNEKRAPERAETLITGFWWMMPCVAVELARWRGVVVGLLPLSRGAGLRVHFFVTVYSYLQLNSELYC